MPTPRTAVPRAAAPPFDTAWRRQRILVRSSSPTHLRPQRIALPPPAYLLLPVQPIAADTAGDLQREAPIRCRSLTSDGGSKSLRLIGRPHCAIHQRIVCAHFDITLELLQHAQRRRGLGIGLAR